MEATIERHPDNPEWVRVRWVGWMGPHYADFDPCPLRLITAEESARLWSRNVLGCEPVTPIPSEE